MILSEMVGVASVFEKSRFLMFNCTEVAITPICMQNCPVSSPEPHSNPPTAQVTYSTNGGHCETHHYM